MPAHEAPRRHRGPAPTHPFRRSMRRSLGLGITLLLAVAITASASGLTFYRIKPGDTLSAIAARYHVSVAELVRLNHLPGNGNLIYAGATLRIPRHAHAVRHSHWRIRTSIYVVRPGDSLYAIAAREHVGWRAIARRNHLPSSLMVIIGQRLRIPHRVHVTSGAPSYGGTSRARAVFGHRWVPSRDAVVGMIRATAGRWGVDRRLALAISYEESGFNQRNVSVTGAIGAMQVMPSTGAWVSAYIVRRPLDLLDAQDNVTAGVALLSVLLRETRGNMAQAVAGYYQGLASVRHRGMYRDTKQYVANVLALRNRF